MHTKENQRVRLTKTLLKNSLVDLMKAKSIYKITIKEICDNADVNRSTFYKHYNTEFDLLKDIEDEYLNTIEDYITFINKDFTLKKLLEYLEDNIDVFELFLDDIPGNDFYERLIKMCFVKMDYDQDLIKNNDIENREYLYHFIIFGALSIVKNWMAKEKRESSTELNDALMKIIGRFLN